VLPPDVRGPHHVKKKTVEQKQKWREQSEAARQEAAKLPYGKLKSELQRKASQLKTASQINMWPSSPGLQPPT
jgi:hypothetical protein